MLLSLPRHIFSEQLQIVAKTAPAKSPVPALEGIYFEVTPTGTETAQITVSAANMEMVISASSQYDLVEAREVVHFACVLPARVQEIVRRLPGDNVRLMFDRETNAVTFFSHRPDGKSESEFQLYGLDPQDFPRQEAIPSPELCLSIKASDLRRSLRQILFAVSADESQPAFTGVHFKIDGEKLILSASDTYRVATTSCRNWLSGASEQVPGEHPLIAGSGSFLVPGRLMQECMRTFGEGARLQGEQTVTFTLAKNKVLLESMPTGQSGREVKIFSRLMDENFPNIERVLPKEFAGSSVISTRELTSCLERALVLTETGSPVLKFNFEQNSLTINASSRYGKVQEKVEAEGEGAELEILFNARFLLDMLKVCEGEEVIFKSTGPNRGVLLKDSLYEEYLYFLLPVKR